jgi:hypothetical protein
MVMLRQARNPSPGVAREVVRQVWSIPPVRDARAAFGPLVYFVWVAFGAARAR